VRAVRSRAMIDWLHSLPFVWLVVVVFGVTYVVAAAISWAVLRLAVGERASAFKAVSAGLLPPLGVVFGLLVGFLAVQVWNDVGQAQTAVDREASALRSVVLLGASFPGAPQARIRALMRQHIKEAVNEEWPAMAGQHATLTVVPTSLAEALHLALALNPHSEGEKVAQREMVAALENALDARRERIIVSESRVNWAKWTGVVLLAALTLLAIAFVHSEKRSTTAIAMGIFASAVAVCLLLIASQDRPFAGPFAVKPDALVQVMPAAR
jgi:Protein of unknown function (DUF4239)